MSMPTKPDFAAEFEALRPVAKALRRMQGQHRPFSSGYLALAIPLAALDEAAEKLTGRRHLYGAQHDTVGAIKP